MHDILNVHEPLLVNLLGHSVGALIFGIFVFLLLRDRSGFRLRANRPAIAAASLAFFWNFSSLLVLGLKRTGEGTLLVVAAGASALSLLPAVLLHLALERRFRSIVVTGYCLSAAAILIHSSELLVPAPESHRLALLLITLGFGALTVIAVVGLLLSRDPDRHRLPRVMGTMSLFLFAMSFVHLSAGQVNWIWPLELVVHHAGIPLALFVLLQDYRFMLLDAFARFLANILLAAGFTFLGAALVSRLSLLPRSAANPFFQALLLMGCCLFLILFALSRTWVQRLLTRIVFRRPDLEGTLEQLRARGSKAAGEAEYFDCAARRLAEFMGAALVEAGESVLKKLAQSDLLFPAPAETLADLRDELDAIGAEVVVPLRISPAEMRHIFLGRRRGGRRYLSEDLQALARLSAQIAEHLEQARETEMRRLVSQAELRALQSQIHPHFLFNALNTLYGVIPKEAAGARRTVLNLADIFRYFLQSDRTFIPLEEELNIIKAYLEIESLRLGPKLRTEIEIDEGALSWAIPILSIEPLVENAVKHGVAARADGGLVRLRVTTSADGLAVSVEDTGAGFADAARSGVGLENVIRRLKLCYGPDAELRIDSGSSGTQVRFLVPAPQTAEAVR